MNNIPSNQGGTMLLNLRVLRIRQGLTQWSLAAETQIPASRLSLLERGLVVPSPTEKEALCKALNASVGVLFRKIRRPHAKAVGI
jgi:transcriptional regulator with XRE-family HTH domain